MGKDEYRLRRSCNSEFRCGEFRIEWSGIQDNPLLTVLGYSLVVDWSLRSWQLFVAALAGLSLAIVFLVDDAFKDYEAAEERNDGAELARAKRKLSWVERLVRLRFIFTLVYMILVGGQTVLFFNSSACWVPVPANVQTWAEFFYGPRAPPPTDLFCATGSRAGATRQGLSHC